MILNGWVDMFNTMVKISLIGGAYYLYKNGYFEELINPANAFSDSEKAEVSVAPPPSLDFPIITSTSVETDYLDANWSDVHNWARSNKLWVSAMMWQESRGNPNAVSSKGARGLMQVVPSTMGDLYDRLGYRKYPPEPTLLHQPNVGIYFGTAYLQEMQKINSDREWITRAYNAGPAGRRTDGTWPAETVNYLIKIKDRYTQLGGV